MTSTISRPSAHPQTGTRPAVRRVESVGSGRTSTSSTGWRLPVFVGALGFLISFAGSWIPSYWGDEAASVMSAERSIPSLLGMLRNVDAVHGTYYLFLHFWIGAFGASETSTRLPSALVAGAMVAGTAVIGRMLIGREFAIVAALAAAVLPRTLYFGADARSYAFSTAIAVWLTALLVVLGRHRFTTRGRTRLAWLGYAALAALGLYVFVYLGLLLIVHGAYVLVSRRFRGRRRAWAASAGVALLAATPIVALGYGQRAQIAFLARRNYATPKSVFVSQWFGNPVLASVCWALMALAIVVAVARLVPAVRERRARRAQRAVATSMGEPASPTVSAAPAAAMSHLVLLTALWALLPTALLLTANAVAPAYNLRYVSFSVPAVALLLTAGIWTLRSRIVHSVALALLVVLALPTDIAERGPFAKDGGSDLAQASTIIGARAAPGDAVVFDSTTLPSQRPRLGLHLYPKDYAGLVDVTLKTPYTARAQLWDTASPLSAVTNRLAGIDRVWVVEVVGSPDESHGTDIHTLQSLGYRIDSTQVVHRTVIYSLSSPSKAQVN